MMAEISFPAVYCGPSVKGVARQYTVYASGIPDALDKFFESCPCARALLVPVSSFAKTRKNLETAGTRESVLYRKVRKQLQTQEGGQ